MSGSMRPRLHPVQYVSHFLLWNHIAVSPPHAFQFLNSLLTVTFMIEIFFFLSFQGFCLICLWFLDLIMEKIMTNRNVSSASSWVLLLP